MTWLLSPLAWLLLAGAIACWGSWVRPRRPWVLAACGLVAVAALGAMTPLGSNALTRPLERPVHASRACQDAPPSVALVLGGGMAGRPRHGSDFAVLNLASRRRVDRAVAWWREDEGRALVLVGGDARPGVPTIAELMATYAGMLGVPAAALRLETRSGDTWGNARHAAELSPRLPRRVVLVTSQVHMPRAQRAFTAAGFEICPLGADSRILPSRLPWALVPRTSGLVNTEAALHEWVGLAYYRWRDGDESSASAASQLRQMQKGGG